MSFPNPIASATIPRHLTQLAVLLAGVVAVVLLWSTGAGADVGPGQGSTQDVVATGVEQVIAGAMPAADTAAGTAKPTTSSPPAGAPSGSTPDSGVDQVDEAVQDGSGTAAPATPGSIQDGVTNPRPNVGGTVTPGTPAPDGSAQPAPASPGGASTTPGEAGSPTPPDTAAEGGSPSGSEEPTTEQTGTGAGADAEGAGATDGEASDGAGQGQGTEGSVSAPTDPKTDGTKTPTGSKSGSDPLVIDPHAPGTGLNPSARPAAPVAPLAPAPAEQVVVVTAAAPATPQPPPTFMEATASEAGAKLAAPDEARPPRRTAQMAPTRDASAAATDADTSTEAGDGATRTAPARSDRGEGSSRAANPPVPRLPERGSSSFGGLGSLFSSGGGSSGITIDVQHLYALTAAGIALMLARGLAGTHTATWKSLVVTTCAERPG